MKNKKKEIFSIEKKKKGLSEQEEKELNSLIVSFRVGLSILLTSNVFTIILIFYLLLFVGASSFNIIQFCLNSFNFSYLKLGYENFFLLLGIAILFVFLFYKSKFSLDFESGSKKYLYLTYKQHKKLFWAILFIMLSQYFLVYFLAIYGYYTDPKNLLTIWYATTIIFPSLYIFTIVLPLFNRLELYKLYPEFLKYAKKEFKDFSSPSNKIKIYHSLSTIHAFYSKEIENCLGKKAVSMFKINALYILAFKINSLDLKYKSKNTIMNILNELEKVHPIEDSNKFIKKMERIEKSYGNNFPQITMEDHIKGELISKYTIAKISVIPILISIVSAILKLFGFI